MEAINYLLQWNKWLLAIIPASAGFMITYQALRKSFAVDDATIADANGKISNTIKGAIICECLSGFIYFIKAFYI